MKKSALVGFVFCIGLLFSITAYAADLYVGAASADFTPDRPVLLQGQMCTRIAYEVETPITASALAIESRDGENSLGAAIFVSFDLCSMKANLRDRIYQRFAEAFPEMDPEKTLILCTTHTHTSIATGVGGYALPVDVNREDLLIEDDAAEFIAQRVFPAIRQAWENRVPAQFSYGLGNAVISFNRRSVYQNGEAIMYGETDREDFRKVEGMEDHDVGSVFFWDRNNKLLAMMVNPSCPSQEVEGRSQVNADYWHPIREQLRAKYGDDVVILGLCGAAGDLSPHIRYRNEAIDRMIKLRNQEIPLADARMQEIARKVVAAVDEVYPIVEPVKSADVPFVHEYALFDIPQQRIPDDLYDSFKRQTAEWKEKLDADANNGVSEAYCRYNWTKSVVDRYDKQRGIEKPTFKVGAHFIRIGDLAFATNPFELYTDFGVQMKARAKATQLIIVQLCALVEANSYVPSQYATQGGGYGAIPQSNQIGAEGGQIFTDKSIQAINALFEAKK